MALSLDIVFTMAIMMEILVYGIYATMFFFTLIVMRKHRPYSQGRGRGWIFLYSTILMFVLATLHIFLSIHRFLRAYITKPGPLIGVGYMFNSQSWDNILHNLLFCFMTWIGDILMMYRCYIVWNKNIWVTVLPAVILLLSIVINIYVTIWFYHNPNLTVKTLTSNWIVDLIFPVGLTKNMFATGLIAWKIWTQHRISKKQGVDWSSRLNLIGVLRIVVESAMIYTLQILVLMILNLTHNNAMFIVQSLGIPSIGIVFALISLRVHYAKQVRKGGTELGESPTWEREIDSAIEFSPRHTPPTEFLTLRIPGERSVAVSDLEKLSPSSETDNKLPFSM